MNYQQEMEALKQQQAAYYAGAQQTVGLAGDCQAETPILKNALNSSYRIPLKQQIENSAAEADHIRSRQQRAHDILTRHPEFEEFLELQDIINRGLWR